MTSRPDFKETLMEHTIPLGSLRRCTTAILIAVPTGTYVSIRDPNLISP